MTHRTSIARLRGWRAAFALLLAATGAHRSGATDSDRGTRLHTLRTLDGQKLRLGEQRGQVVLVNFWATWCGPCRQEDAAPQQAVREVQVVRASCCVNVDDDAKPGCRSRLQARRHVSGAARQRQARQPPGTT
jgi:thiol:disulfide interchange protein